MRNDTISTIDEPISAFVDDRVIVIRKCDWEEMLWKMENLERDMGIYKEVVFTHMKNINAHKEGFKE